MNDNDFECEYEVRGAPVIYSNLPPKVHNPLNRPEVKFIKPVVFLVIFILLNIAVTLLVRFLIKSGAIPQEYMVAFVQYRWVPVVLADLIYLRVIAKRAIIWLVHVYQHYASDQVRLKCVFEPSCSEYMILALRKYGLYKGLYKGINRLLRCHPPNGGRDDP